MAPNMEDRKASTLDDQKHGAEDEISRRCHSTTGSSPPKMEDQQAPTSDDQMHGVEYG